MNCHYLFLFIRQDLTVPQQIVQSSHAIYHLCEIYHPECSSPNHVVIGVPDQRALKRVLTKLKENKVPHYAFDEPDGDLGLTAIATVPLTVEQKQVLANYRLYNAGGAEQSACGVNSTPAPIPG